MVEKLSADCEHYREMVTSREKAMKVRTCFEIHLEKLGLLFKKVVFDEMIFFTQLGKNTEKIVY